MQDYSWYYGNIYKVKQLNKKSKSNKYFLSKYIQNLKYTENPWNKNPRFLNILWYQNK